MKLSELKKSVDDMYKCLEAVEDPEIVIQGGTINPAMTFMLDGLQVVKTVYTVNPRPISQVIMTLKFGMNI